MPQTPNPEATTPAIHYSLVLASALVCGLQASHVSSSPVIRMAAGVGTFLLAGRVLSGWMGITQVDPRKDV